MHSRRRTDCPLAKPFHQGVSMPRRTLTAKQEAFARTYLANGRNAAAAYRTAHNTCSSPKVASAEGARLLKHPGIALELRGAIQAAAADLKLTAERVLAEAAMVAFFDPRRLFRSDHTLKPPSEWDVDTAAAVASLQTYEEWQGRGQHRRSAGLTKRVQFGKKVEALKLLMEYLGLLKGKGAPSRGPSYKVYLGNGMQDV